MWPQANWAEKLNVGFLIMPSKSFLVEDQNGIVVLTINRPDVLNALNGEVLDEFSEVLDEIRNRKGLQGLIFTGAGKAFIAGADIVEMSEMDVSAGLSFARKGQNVTQKLETMPVPVIAAVNGFALGGGCEMAISCDFIVASERAVFGQPEVALGLIPGFGGSVRLAKFVGWPLAKELIFTGRKIKAEEALRIGLANRVVEPDQLIPECLKIFELMQRNSTAAISRAKTAMELISRESDIVKQLVIEAKEFSEVFGTDDQKEGTKAFVEKRRPLFKGI